MPSCHIVTPFLTYSYTIHQCLTVNHFFEFLIYILLFLLSVLQSQNFHYFYFLLLLLIHHNPTFISISYCSYQLYFFHINQIQIFTFSPFNHNQLVYLFSTSFTSITQQSLTIYPFVSIKFLSNLCSACHLCLIVTSNLSCTKHNFLLYERPSTSCVFIAL